MTSNSAVRTFHRSLARRIVDKRASIDVLSSGGRSASNSAQNSRIVVMLAPAGRRLRGDGNFCWMSLSVTMVKCG